MPSIKFGKSARKGIGQIIPNWGRQNKSFCQKIFLTEAINRLTVVRTKASELHRSNMIVSLYKMSVKFKENVAVSE